MVKVSKYYKFRYSCNRTTSCTASLCDSHILKVLPRVRYAINTFLYDYYKVVKVAVVTASAAFLCDFHKALGRL